MKKSESSNVPYALARVFIKEASVDRSPTIWHWQGSWYSWKKTHYQATSDQEVKQRILRWLKKNSIPVKVSLVNSVFELLKLEQTCSSSKAPFWLQHRLQSSNSQFVLRNGLLSIKKDSAPELNPHSPKYFCLAAADYRFQSNAKCRKWIEFMNQLWPDDAQSVGLLQEWFGYCLLPDTSQQKLLSIIGPPRSGKSTVARVLTELLGRTNVASPSIRSLSGSFGLWGLLDKKLAIIPDATLPTPCPALEELLKSISGEDAVDIQRKGMSPLTGITLPTRLMLLANEMPSFSDPSGALKQRLLTLKTTQSFFGQEDTQLTKNLLTELPGILNWSIDGLQRHWTKGRFQQVTELDAEKLLKAVPNPDRVRKIVIEYA